MTIKEMRAIANNRATIEETVSTYNRATYEQYKEVTEELFKEANEHIKQAKKYKKDDNTNAAKKELDQAIRKLNQGMKEADNIDDDNFFILLLEAEAQAFCASGLISLVSTAIAGPLALATQFVISWMYGIQPTWDIMKMRKLGLEKYPDKPSLIKVPQNRTAAKKQIYNMIKCCEKLKSKL